MILSLVHKDDFFRILSEFGSKEGLDYSDYRDFTVVVFLLSYLDVSRGWGLSDEKFPRSFGFFSDENSACNSLIEFSVFADGVLGG
ncbi:hypothetical protein, partial [Pseudomonas sp. HMWF032]|uniref:hypothetical protein n=1 Tax=Pseudomonas sp. HMWF032 TaxID=2056866 RepID=UPI0011B1EF8A